MLSHLRGSAWITAMGRPHFETKRRGHTRLLIRPGIQQARDSGDSRDRAGVLAAELEGSGTDHLLNILQQPEALGLVKLPRLCASRSAHAEEARQSPPPQRCPPPQNDGALTLPLLMESRSRSLGIVDHHPPEYAIRCQFFRGELQWSSEFW